MTDQTPAQRLAAALHKAEMCWDVDGCSGPEAHSGDVRVLLEADPTIICPDPEAHALADAVRRLPDTAYNLLVEYDSTVEATGQECQLSLTYWLDDDHDAAIRTHGHDIGDALAATATALEDKP